MNTDKNLEAAIAKDCVPKDNSKIVSALRRNIYCETVNFMIK